MKREKRYATSAAMNSSFAVMFPTSSRIHYHGHTYSCNKKSVDGGVRSGYGFSSTGREAINNGGVYIPINLETKNFLAEEGEAQPCTNSIILLYGILRSVVQKAEMEEVCGAL